MKRKAATKSFDCLEFKRQAQAEIYEDIKNMNPEEERDYFRKQAENGPFGKWWKKLKHLAEEGAVVTTPARRTSRARARKTS